MYYTTTYPSPVGTLALACDEKSLVGLWLDGQKYHGDGVPGKLLEKDDLPLLDAAKQWLDDYFAGENPAISTLPLAPLGSAFRQGVWELLCEIPYGEVTTYGALAKQMEVRMNKQKMACQAVGGAVGHNPISIIIPCHRVVGTNGSLTGYGGGIQRKIQILKLEGVDTSQFFVPTKGTAL
jgi:methylated-DNA-[protein]-cysteine S-methyltransferase